MLGAIPFVSMLDAEFQQLVRGCTLLGSAVCNSLRCGKRLLYIYTTHQSLKSCSAQMLFCCCRAGCKGGGDAQRGQDWRAVLCSNCSSICSIEPGSRMHTVSIQSPCFASRSRARKVLLTAGVRDLHLAGAVRGGRDRAPAPADHRLPVCAARRRHAPRRRLHSRSLAGPSQPEPGPAEWHVHM